MSGWLEKQRDEDNALSRERQLMDKALARLGQVERRAGGRLIFGLDLTSSREASLRQARVATASMFDTIKAIGSVAVKLVYFRGKKECRASEWHDDPEALCRSMLKLSCDAGNTQIGRLLRMVLDETERVSAVVFVGDHCEDNPDELLRLAETLGQRSIPVFVFHECADWNEQYFTAARPVFKQLAEISGGVYCEFKGDSGAVLRELLSGVAAFTAAGTEGVKLVALPETPEARQLRGRLLLGSGG